MPIWSSLVRGFGQLSQTNGGLRNVFAMARRQCSHGPPNMNVTPSRFQWEKFKDLIHYYALVGAIPCTLIVLYANIFIGPATLEPIPEGYEPKYWEYHRHPITRFIARYFQHNPQQDYEKFMHFAHEEQEKAELRKLERDVKAKMAERNDYQAFFYRPAMAKYYRSYHEIAKERAERMGD